MLGWDGLEGAQAAITGGASGLGAATVEYLQARGMDVTVLDRDTDKGQAISNRLGVRFIELDVASADSVAQAAEQVASGAPLRVVVNCAGVGGAAKTVSRGRPHDFEKFARTININLIGSFNVASQLAAIMSQTEPYNSDGGRGVIVNTASVAAYDGQVGQLAYAASKGGIVSMTLPMARDLADKGIRVNTIAPGLFLTPLLDELPAEVQDSLGKQVPFPSRLGSALEYADLVGSIVQNTMLNGEVIRLDGAIRMAPR